MSDEKEDKELKGAENIPVYDYYDLNLNQLSPKLSNYGNLGLGLNKASVGLNSVNLGSTQGLGTNQGLGSANLGLRNLGLNNLGLTSLGNGQQLQNKVFNDYGDYGAVHVGYHDYGIGPGYGHYGFGHYCQEDQVNIGLLVATVAGIGLMWYTLYTKIQANGGRKKRESDTSWYSSFVNNIQTGKKQNKG